MTAAADAGDPADSASAALPEASWQKLLPLASETLAATPPEQLPGPLRRFARFAPARRLKLAAAALRQALESDADFRTRVAELARHHEPDACEAIDRGETGDDAFHSAALAFVSRPDGWESIVAEAQREAEQHSQANQAKSRINEAEQRAAGAEHDRATAVREAEKLRVELTEARTEAAELRERHREASRELREVKRRERKLSDALSSEKGRRKQDEQRHSAEVKRLKTELEESLRSLERARRGARDSRSFHESRVWLLLETIGDAAAGLRRELSQDPAERTPADFVAEHDGLSSGAQQPARSERALESDDPARLDELIKLPHSHLIVDGYNVTIGGYGESTLEQQRLRLVKGLSALAAQSGAEVTVVFDGADRMVGLPTPPRGVRVLFSRKDQTADEVIRALVRAEPDGRPVVVISSDREVADGVRRHGAYPLASTTLLRRLERS